MGTSTADEAVEVVRALETLNVASDRLRGALAKRLRISATDLHALSIVSTVVDVTPKELAVRLDLTSGSVTTLIDRLENRSYVERVSHPQDRRSLLVRPTPGGVQVLGWAVQHHLDAIGAVLATSPGLDAQALTAVLGSASLALHEACERVAAEAAR